MATEGPADKVNGKTSSPMMSTEQPGLLVLVADGTEITSHYLEIGILSNIVLCHLKHAKVEISNWAERTTCDEYDRSL